MDRHSASPCETLAERYQALLEVASPQIEAAPRARPACGAFPTGECVPSAWPTPCKWDAPAGFV